MAKKLGLPTLDSPRDSTMAKDALAVPQAAETDMTIFWRELSSIDCDEALEKSMRVEPLMNAVYGRDGITEEQKAVFVDFADNWAARQRELGTNDEQRRISMNAVNPKYVLRNYMAQLAIERAEQGDASLVEELLDLLRFPYAEQASKDHYYSLRPDWARTKVGCSQLSCSS